VIERRRDQASSRRNVRLAFLILMLVATLAITAVAVFAHENRDRAAEGQEAHDALCVIQASIALRVERTKEFLKQNPGPLILGIPRREFEKGLANDILTLKGLSNLVCVPPADPVQTH
jgi:hypothetical protein